MVSKYFKRVTKLVVYQSSLWPSFYKVTNNTNNYNQTKYHDKICGDILNSYIYQQRKPDNAIKFDMCDNVSFFLVFFPSFKYSLTCHHSRVHVHRLLQRNEKM